MTENVQGSIAPGATDEYVSHPPYCVWWEDPEGVTHNEARFYDVKPAVEKVKEILARKPAAALRIFRRIIIVDGGDFTVFEWLIDRGITWPPQERDQK
jgi:hypothetical protein